MTNQMKSVNVKRIFGLLILGLSLQACQQNSGGGSGADSNASPSQVSCPASLDQSSYFEDVTSSTDLSSAQDKGEPAALRTRTVRVNVEAMKADMKAGHANMKLDLFNDKTLMVTVERIQEFAKDNYVLTGRINDDALSSVSLALNKDVLIANINQSTGPRYNISYKGSGVHAIQETSAQDVDNDESSCLATPAPAATAQDVSASNSSADPSTHALAATPVIDMLVAYTPNAKAKAGGDAAMLALIQGGIADTNKAFIDSGVNLQARLVGVMAVSQNETGNWSSDLSALSGKTDGLWDEVHAERARLGADQVTMVGVYPNDTVAGIGFIKSTSSSAFTVTKVSAFPNYSFTHELGHNVGLNHSDGYVNTNGSFRTIMAYGSVVRILHFSNPNIPYKNYATGTSSNNSAAILNANGATTAGFAASKVSSTTPDVPVIPGTGPSPNCN